MDKLLQPNLGLMVWTAVTFLLLLAVLTKAAWKPILDGLSKREGKIKSDLERAEQAQKDAEALRQKYETQLAEAQQSIQGLIQEARSEGEKTRAHLLTTAKEESEKILQKGRAELSGEAERLKEELRSDVADLSVLIAEKILRRSVDEKIQSEILKEAITFSSEVKK